MDDKTVKAITNSIIESLPKEEKSIFNHEERNLLEETIRIRAKNKNNPKIRESCDRTLENMETIKDKIKFKIFVDASIDIATGLLVTGGSIAQPELAPILAIVGKQIAKKAKEIY